MSGGYESGRACSSTFGCEGMRARCAASLYPEPKSSCSFTRIPRAIVLAGLLRDLGACVACRSNGEIWGNEEVVLF